MGTKNKESERGDDESFSCVSTTTWETPRLDGVTFPTIFGEENKSLIDLFFFGGNRRGSGG